jgi:P-type Ca2+ transporter type 2C
MQWWRTMSNQMASTVKGPLGVAEQHLWSLDVADVIERYGTDLAQGLSSEQVAGRLVRYGPNQLKAASPVPAWRKLLDQFADPLVYLLLAAVVASLIAWLLEGRHGVPFEVIAILAIVVANGVLGYVQSERADAAIAALQQMLAVSARVMRDGIVQQVRAEEVVPGDLLVLAEGDAICADARLVDVFSLMTMEASLTGESEPVTKSVERVDGPALVGERVNTVFSGTSVVRGKGRAVVTATAMDTEMGSIAHLLDTGQPDKTPLQRDVARIGTMLGAAVVIIAAVIMVTIWLTASIDSAADVIDVGLIGVSLAVAAVPESLPAVMSVVLALGVQRMARQRALVTKLSSVETLGSACVVCSDKTGTLTTNEMSIDTVVTSSGQAHLVATPAGPAWQVGDGVLGAGTLYDEVRAVLVRGCLANDATIQVGDHGTVVQGDPTDGAFLLAAPALGVTTTELTKCRRVGEIAFTSQRKRMSSLVAGNEVDSPVELITKGAPDVILTLCSHEAVGAEIVALTAVRRRGISSTIDRLADQGLRTIAVAYRILDGEPENIDESIESNLVYVGVVGMMDPARPEARQAIVEARRAGIRTVMITGDHPRTAARIASDIGLGDGSGPIVTGANLDDLDDESLRRLAQSINVYARVSPEHKLRIVNALRAEQLVVAMTGDGVNDAPALKAADIGVAMGISGTDVTKQAADMILTDDNFATIVAAVKEGRAIFANIRTFLRFLLSSNIGEVFTMFFGVLGADALGLIGNGETIVVPLLATQILWINLLTDVAPALALGVDPPPHDVMDHPPRRLSDRVIGRSMWVGIVWIGLVTAAVTLIALDLGLAGGLLGGSGSIDYGRTMAFTTLVLAQLFNAFNSRSDETSAVHQLFANRWLWAAVGMSLLLQIAVVELPVLHRPFHTERLGFGDWLTCIGLGAVVLLAAELMKALVRVRHHHARTTTAQRP